MKLKTALLIWIFSGNNLISFSQTLIQTIAKADSLMQAESYLDAEILYERTLFFADSSIYVSSNK
jgi:hypothetical protein